jgi:hypothetical protein
MPKKTRTTTTVITETTEDGDGSAPAPVFVTFLLDRTGSMQVIKDDTIGGFNAYLDSLAELGDRVHFTMLQFDSLSIDRVYVGARLKDVARLNGETFQPRAFTPLYDACAEAIFTTDRALAREEIKGETPPKVIVVFQTDGAENCSVNHKQHDLAALIRSRAAAGWQFVYLGANVDAYATAGKINIPAASTVSYAGERSRQTFCATARNIYAYAVGASASVEYSPNQKAEAGDSSVRPGTVSGTVTGTGTSTSSIP